MKKHKIKESTTNRLVYNKLNKFIPPYYDDEYYWSCHYNKGIHADWRKKQIYKFQYREYRTWKYNRKTQWKNQ